jgi:ribonucleotide monophosphatase NagD (HAD superfamily)
MHTALRTHACRVALAQLVGQCALADTLTHHNTLLCMHTILRTHACRVGPLLFPGTGPLLAAIQSASGVSPMVIGKPNPLLLKRILVLFGCDAARTTMVGDR